MKLSTRGKYGLYAMYYLAAHAGEGPQTLQNISTVGVPKQYLEQILGNLRRAGLVSTVRGAQGGYHLAQPPQKITVGMILRATEGDLAPAECVLDGAMHCDRRGACPSRTVFSKVYSAINGVIDSVTLRELMPENGETPSCSSQEKSAGSEGSL